MKTKLFYTFLLFLVLAAGPLHADWQRTPASDVDKEFISGNEGLVIGLPPKDNSCWLAATSNMLAAAGYSSSGGTGNTIQERADEIYFDLITWQAATTSSNSHGVKHGGWALARYNRDNERLWVTRLPEVCPGMCDIPGGRGVMLGYFKLGHVYHYEPGGLLIGVAKLGDAAGNQTGWMDNTAALTVARDPRDGKLDVFGEDSWLNRIIWYRVDDRDIQVVKGKPK